jgi:hypothetical protein
VTGNDRQRQAATGNDTRGLEHSSVPEATLLATDSTLFIDRSSDVSGYR